MKIKFKKTLPLLMPGLLLLSSPTQAYEGDLYFNTELAYLTMSDEDDSATPYALYLRFGREIADGVVLQGYYGTGLLDDYLVNEQTGIDSFRIATDLSQAYGVEMKLFKRLSYKSNVYMTAGYGKTEVDITEEDCFGGINSFCNETTLTAAENGFNYGVGFNYGGFVLSYHVYFDDYVEELDTDTRITGINMGYMAKF